MIPESIFDGLLSERAKGFRDFLKGAEEEGQRRAEEDARAQGLDPEGLDQTFFETAVRRNPEHIAEAIRNLARAETSAAVAREAAAQQSLDDAIRQDLFKALGAGFKAGSSGDISSLERNTQAAIDAQKALRGVQAETAGVAERAKAAADLKVAELEEETRVANLKEEQRVEKSRRESFAEKAARETAAITDPELKALEIEQELKKGERLDAETEAQIEANKALTQERFARARELDRKRLDTNLQKGDFRNVPFEELINQSNQNQAEIEAINRFQEQFIAVSSRLAELEARESAVIPPTEEARARMEERGIPIPVPLTEAEKTEMAQLKAQKEQFKGAIDNLLLNRVEKEAQQARLNRFIVEDAATKSTPAQMITFVNDAVAQGNTTMLEEVRPALRSKLDELTKEQLKAVIGRHNALGNIFVATQASDIYVKKFVNRPSPRELNQ